MSFTISSLRDEGRKWKYIEEEEGDQREINMKHFEMLKVVEIQCINLV